MGDFTEPETQTVSREPEGFGEFRQEAVQPFLRGLFQNPTGASNPFAQQAGATPEARVLQRAQPALGSLVAGGGLGAAQQVIESAQPQFAENLQEAQAQFTSQAPSTFNTAAGAGLGDLTQSALQDFNRFQAQALQQGQQTGIQAAGQFGQLARGAGQAQTQRFVNPTLQLLTSGIGFGRPIPSRTVAGPSPFSQLVQGASAAGTAALGVGAFGGGGGS